MERESEVVCGYKMASDDDERYGSCNGNALNTQTRYPHVHGACFVLFLVLWGPLCIEGRGVCWNRCGTFCTLEAVTVFVHFIFVFHLTCL